MFYISDVYYNRGVLHSVDQDSLVLLQALTSQGRVLMAAVCDGIGGMDSGECASGFLGEELVTWFYDGLLELIGKKKPLWIIRRSCERKIYQVQSRLRHFADKRSLSMGSTLSMLVLWERRYMLWHLGNSRIYRFNACGKKGLGRHKIDEMKLMTKDHTDISGRLLKCVGSFGYFVPDFKMGNIKKGEAFLLCSDGFRNRMRVGEMSEALAPDEITEDKIRKRLGEIGDAALRRGEKDDISAIYIKIC